MTNDAGLQLGGCVTTMPRMAESVRIEHTFDCSEDTFWNELFFDEEYNRRIFIEALKFPVWKEVERRDSDQTLHRVIEVVPRVGDMPTALKKIVGENLGYREEGQYDKAKRRYRINIVPNALKDKLSVQGELFTEPAGDGKCRRVFSGTINAKIFGVGGILEKRVAQDLEKSYAVGARFTQEYIKEKGL
jgi:hypothetical protein